MRAFGLSLAAALCSAGCGVASAPDAGEPAALDAGETGVTDAGHDAGTDAGVEGVRGVAFVRYHTSGGVVSVPEDVSTFGLEAWSFDGTEFVPATITYPAVGEFTVRLQREGTVYLRRPTSDDATWYVTNGQALDLSRFAVGRPDATLHEQSEVSVSVALNDAVPWQAGDGLDLFSPEVGTYGSVLLASKPAEGATSYSSSGTFYPLGRIPGIDPSRGDTVYVLKSRTFASTVLGQYTTLVSSTRLTNVEWPSSSGLSIGGSLSSTLNRQLDFDVRFSSFAALAGRVHPEAFPRWTWITISVTAPGLSTAGLGPSLFFYFRRDWTADVAGTETYGDPFASGWGRFAEVRMSFGRALLLPGTTSGYVPGSIVVRVPPDRLADGLVPAVEPVRQLTIDGKDATLSQSITTLSPVIAWQAPAGTIAGYFITISELSASGTATVIMPSGAMIFTEETSVRVPPGTFVSGKTYYFNVYSVVDDMWTPAAPFEFGTGGSAAVISDIITVE